MSNYPSSAQVEAAKLVGNIVDFIVLSDIYSEEALGMASEKLDHIDYITSPTEQAFIDAARALLKERKI